MNSFDNSLKSFKNSNESRVFLNSNSGFNSRWFHHSNFPKNPIIQSIYLKSDSLILFPLNSSISFYFFCREGSMKAHKISKNSRGALSIRNKLKETRVLQTSEGMVHRTFLTAVKGGSVSYNRDMRAQQKGDFHPPASASEGTIASAPFKEHKSVVRGFVFNDLNQFYQELGFDSRSVNQITPSTFRMNHHSSHPSLEAGFDFMSPCLTN